MVGPADFNVKIRNKKTRDERKDGGGSASAPNPVPDSHSGQPAVSQSPCRTLGPFSKHLSATETTQHQTRGSPREGDDGDGPDSRVES